jgi:hypothetical protein
MWLRRRSLPLLAAAAGIVLIPFMGWCVPWRAALQEGGGERLRLLTCNIHRHALDAAAFASWLNQSHPDLVILQAWSSRFEPLFPQGPWHVRRDGELFVASRYPITSADPAGGIGLGRGGGLLRAGHAHPIGPRSQRSPDLAAPGAGSGAGALPVRTGSGCRCLLGEWGLARQVGADGIMSGSRRTAWTYRSSRIVNG